MIVDEAVLRAFVDGELDAATRQQVETALAHSAELQAQVQALRASCLPYQAAFDMQALPPLPDTLTRHVRGMTAVAAAPTATGATLEPRRRRVVGWGWAVAASFAAGLAVPWRPWGSKPDAAGDPWVPAIAGYQALYVRETIDQKADSPARLRELLAGFDDGQRRALFVPDLSSAGMQFKRVQRLGFGHTPLIQMVYLPTRGRPTALCVLPLGQPAAAPTLQRLDGLAVASWSRDGLSLVLVADLDDASARALAQALYDGKLAPVAV
jgi:anti-sigma factor RsiW